MGENGITPGTTSDGRILGLLGGMAWPSTMDAYRHLNETVHSRLGGVHSANLVLRSFDFAQVEALQAAGDWEGAGQLLGVAAGGLRAAGAGAIMICTNTMHRVADRVEALSGLPVLHIADATAAVIQDAKVGKVGLLGTAYTMEGDFYRGRLAAHGLEVIVPDEEDRAVIHGIIYDELVNGVVTEDSRAAYKRVMAGLVAAGAEGIVSGCTEIELLVGPEDTDVRWFPTTAIHVEAAAEWLLGGPTPTPPPA